MLPTLLRTCLTTCRKVRLHKIESCSYSTYSNIREYFYHIDVHGQLFLEDTKPKNFTTCFKDKRFLDFFFQRLRVNDTGRNEQYPYVSPCGKELNYILSEDAPIVFSDLDGEQLVWAGDKRFLFHPEKILVSSTSGRIYHPSPKTLNNKTKHAEMALLKSSLVLTKFAEHLDLENRSFFWNGNTYPIQISEHL
ncbi:hypothetical protein K493DRAFT_314163 [Basidiobolus meristosporus CBS 931.73]|uniref:Uncharacterized protein n=1 Tax=Basidiobolus meristosporus CBS 931.73 TaxID=1314790 RepID=A0A1Y1YGT5_9FUNG|nr:hypothetical protein K493DRAFT_314163 [Basidiobolus meristosporus CBS 931.73]|eukprot:ORX97189.1 hypothetical protein K493DRAFT_314163 [Basidiobolus meristosporus CBS 931.73]